MANLTDDQNPDTLGVKAAIERMLGRNLSPSAASQLTPQQAAPQTDAQGVPFYLSKERSPIQDEQAPPQKDTPDDNSNKDTSATNQTSSPKQNASAETPGSDDTAEETKKPVLDFGQDSNQHTLEQALAGRNQSLKDAQFQRGIEQLSGGIAKLPVNNQQSDMMYKAASSPIQDYLLRNQEAANDPQSGLSKGLRSYMSTLGLDVPEGATATQMKSVLPYIFKDTEAKQAQAARSEDMAARNAERQQEAQYRSDALKLQREQLHQNRDQAQQEKLAKADTDRLDKMNKLITGEVASGRSAFGQAAKNYQSVQNAQAMLDGTVDPNELDNRQVYELTRVLDRVLSQNGGTMGGSEHLTPDTARSRLAKLTEFVSNKRQGAQAGDFIKTFNATLQREGDMAQKQMGVTQKHLLSSYKDLHDKYPDRFNDILQNQGIPLNVFENEKKSTGPKEPAEPVVSVDDPKDQAAVQRIMQNNPGISIEDATKALHNYKASKSGQ